MIDGDRPSGTVRGLRVLTLNVLDLEPHRPGDVAVPWEDREIEAT